MAAEAKSRPNPRSIEREPWREAQRLPAEDCGGQRTVEFSEKMSRVSHSRAIKAATWDA